MARSAKQLTDTALKKVKAEDKDIILSDGNGLQVKVRKSGSRTLTTTIQLQKSVSTWD